MRRIFQEEAGTQMLQDSLSEYCSISSTCTTERQDSDCTEPSPGEPQELGCDLRDSVQLESSLSPAEAATPQLQAFTLLLVNRTLWIPRFVKKL